jgi:Xaa-Pro aminopeptidase
MKKIIGTLLFVAFTLNVFSQSSEDLPSDFLGKDFHKQRRQALRDKLPPNSVAVLFANAVRNRSNDVDYVYHQDPNFYYLTGYREPDAVLLVFKDKQTANNGAKYDEIIFVQPRDVKAEMWNGRRLGFEGVKTTLGLNQAFNNTDFKKYNVDFQKFDAILFNDFENDVRDNPLDSADLYSLIEQFKQKVNFPSKETLNVALEAQANNLNTRMLPVVMGTLRGKKTPEELALLRKAVSISGIAQREVMKAIKPGMSEREIQGIHEFVFKKYQAEDVGYPSIVGAGHNGCILHYIENYKPNVKSTELILMDLGAEYHGYTADVTRTIPISGKFSPEQRTIYDLVLKAQEEGMKAIRPGITTQQLSAITHQVINRGLAELGIIKSETEEHTYYPHGCCHHIGLDVHDPMPQGPLEENMVITVEPGIYIPENAKCDKRWWGIAVRIEDDCLVTKDGFELLSASAPRTADDVEAMMKEPSALDDFQLPEIK